MPALSNSRHELFAQEMAKGKTLEEAHTAAGYSGNRKAAWPLSRRLDITGRVEELLSQRAQIETEATQQAVQATGLTKAWVIQQAKDVYVEACKDRQHQPALKALELLGREVGAFIERKEIRTGPLEDAVADELEQLHKAIIAERAGRAGGGSNAANKPKPH